MSSVPTLPAQVQAACEVIRERIPECAPELGLVLGSGLGAANLPIEDPVELPAAEIPYLPVPSVEGHRGVWTFGRLAGRSVVVAGGRVHRYEGVSLSAATIGGRILRELGARSLVVTNAAGGIRADLVPGTLMRIRDHINLLGDSPLVGAHHEEMGKRFVDLTEAYDKEWADRAASALESRGVSWSEGVYAACLGPQYETPAEIEYLEKIGADAVGMSTVPEVIVARQVGLSVFGLSLISNCAAGKAPGTLDHEEVIEEGRKALAPLCTIILALAETARR